MKQSDTLINVGIIVAIVVILSLMLIVFLNMRRQKKFTKAQLQAMKELRAMKQYKFLSTFFLSQGRILYISNALSTLNLYKSGQMVIVVVKLYIVSTLLKVAIVVVGVFLFGNIFAIMASIIVAMLVGYFTIDKEVQKISLRANKEMTHLTSSMRQEYLRTGSITEALISITPSKLMARPVALIEEILTSVGGEEKLMKFYESSPFRLLQTFASVCFQINNTGDEYDEVTGESKFLNSLALITSDLNAEIKRLSLIQLKYRVVVYIPLIALITSPIFKIFLKWSMPGTAVVYDGMLGYMGEFITLLLTGLMFYLVSNMSKSTVVSDDDRIPYLVYLYEKHVGLRRFLAKVSPKNAARRKFISKMDEALSRKTPELFVLERLICLVCGVVVGFGLLFFSLYSGKRFLLNTTQSMGLIRDTSLNAYDKEYVLEFDNEYLNRTSEWSDEDALARISGRFPELSDLDVGEYWERLQSKAKALKATKLNMVYILLVYAFAVGMSFLPNLMLYFRRWSAKSAVADDFLQLQSLMATIMSLGVDTVDALEQLCANSRIHKTMLLYAYHSYISNPDKELDRLKMKVTLVEFKRFIDKMKLTISDLSLAEAYSDLLQEREHMVNMREMVMLDSINKRRAIAGMLARIPVISSLVLQGLVPVVYLGIKEFAGSLESLNSIS